MELPMDWENIFDSDQRSQGVSAESIFDGSFLEFKEMSPEFQLYPYQKNAIARILFSKNTLLMMLVQEKLT